MRTLPAGGNVKLVFEVASESDIDDLLLLVKEFYDESGDLIFDAVLTRAAVEELLSNTSLGYALLIKIENMTIGYLILTLGFSLEYYGRDAFVDELYVRKNYRGKGIGTQALKFIRDFGKDIGVRALHLEVDRTNTRAQAFYRKAGFTDHDRYLMTKMIK